MICLIKRTLRLTRFLLISLTITNTLATIIITQMTLCNVTFDVLCNHLHQSQYIQLSKQAASHQLCEWQFLISERDIHVWHKPPEQLCVGRFLTITYFGNKCINIIPNSLHSCQLCEHAIQLDIYRHIYGTNASNIHHAIWFIINQKHTKREV